MIGIIGGTNVVHKDAVVKEMMFKLKEKFGEHLTIASGGNLVGIEATVKATALNFQINYIEFNPSFSGHNQYSALKPTYFGRKYHHSHFYDRYKRLVFEVDALCIGIEEGVKDGAMMSVMKMAQKRGVKTILI